MSTPYIQSTCIHVSIQSLFSSVHGRAKLSSVISTFQQSSSYNDISRSDVDKIQQCGRQLSSKNVFIYLTGILHQMTEKYFTYIQQLPALWWEKTGRCMPREGGGSHDLPQVVARRSHVLPDRKPSKKSRMCSGGLESWATDEPSTNGLVMWRNSSVARVTGSSIIVLCATTRPQCPLSTPSSRSSKN